MKCRTIPGMTTRVKNNYILIFKDALPVRTSDTFYKENIKNCQPARTKPAASLKFWLLEGGSRRLALHKHGKK